MACASIQLLWFPTTFQFAPAQCIFPCAFSWGCLTLLSAEPLAIQTFPLPALPADLHLFAGLRKPLMGTCRTPPQTLALSQIKRRASINSGCCMFQHACLSRILSLPWLVHGTEVAGPERKLKAQGRTYYWVQEHILPALVNWNIIFPLIMAGDVVDTNK